MEEIARFIIDQWPKMKELQINLNRFILSKNSMMNSIQFLLGLIHQIKVKFFQIKLNIKIRISQNSQKKDLFEIKRSISLGDFSKHLLFGKIRNIGG